MTSSFARTLATGTGLAVLLGWAIVIGCTSFSGEAVAVDSEAGIAADTSTPFSCDHVDASFCDDFETLPLGAKWGASAQLVEAGTLTLVDGSATSPLYALRASVLDLGPVANGMIGYAELEHIQPRDLSQAIAIFDFDLKLDAVGQPGEGVVSALSVILGTNRSILLAITDKGYAGIIPTTEDAGGIPSSDHFFTIPPLHTWFHVRIEADLVAERVSVFIDGALRVKDATSIGSKDGQYVVYAGAFAAPSHLPTEVSIDNFVITSR
jgi:hypothetical protein